MMAQMDVPCSLLSDPSEVLDTPADGHYRMYAGGTSQQEMKDRPGRHRHPAAAVAAGEEQKWCRRCGTSPPPRWPFRWDWPPPMNC
jgi:hypothetical protein